MKLNKFCNISQYFSPYFSGLIELVIQITDGQEKHENKKIQWGTNGLIKRDPIGKSNSLI